MWSGSVHAVSRGGYFTKLSSGSRFSNALVQTRGIPFVSTLKVASIPSSLVKASGSCISLDRAIYLPVHNYHWFEFPTSISSESVDNNNYKLLFLLTSEIWGEFPQQCYFWTPGNLSRKCSQVFAGARDRVTTDAYKMLSNKSPFLQRSPSTTSLME